MIRNLQKLRSVEVSESGNKPLPIDIKHQGTIGRLAFLGFNGAALCVATAFKDALDALTLSVTHKNDGNFALVNSLTPGFMDYRHLLHYESLGLSTAAHLLHYDPAAGTGKDESRRNQLTLGTRDLKDMVLDFEFAADTTGCTRVEVWGEVDYNLKQDLGEHIRINSQDKLVPAAGGSVEISTIPFESPELCLNAFHLEEPTDLVVEDWTISINSKQYPLRDVRQDMINQMLKYCYRSPQAGYATLDFNKEDLPAYFFETGLGSLLVAPNFAVDGVPVTANCRLWYEQVRKFLKAA